MKPRHPNHRPSPAWTWVLALLLTLALPTAALAQDAGDPAEKEVTGEQVFVSEDGQVHRIVLAPGGDQDVRVVRVPMGEGGEGGDGEVKSRVKVMVRTDEEGGEPRTFVWNSEDGEAFPLGEGNFVFHGVPRGFLGVQLTDLSGELRTHFGTQPDRGVLVGKVVEDSPAARAGLRVGDVLTHIDGEAVRSSMDVTSKIGSRKDGEVVALEVVRDGRVETLNATLEVRERPQVDVGHFLHKIDLGEGGHWAFRTGEGGTFELDPEMLEKKLEGVRTFLGSEEWRQQMEKMEVDLRKELENLEVELQQMEEHLREMDVELKITEEEMEELDQP